MNNIILDNYIDDITINVNITKTPDSFLGRCKYI